MAAAFFLAGAFLAGAFLAAAFFLAGAFLAGAFLAGAFFFAAMGVSLSGLVWYCCVLLSSRIGPEPSTHFDSCRIISDQFSGGTNDIRLDFSSYYKYWFYCKCNERVRSSRWRRLGDVSRAHRRQLRTVGETTLTAFLPACRRSQCGKGDLPDGGYPRTTAPESSGRIRTENPPRRADRGQGFSASDPAPRTRSPDNVGSRPGVRHTRSTSD